MFDANRGETGDTENQLEFIEVLENFTNAFSRETSTNFSEDQQAEIDQKMDQLGNAGSSVSEQSEALKAMGAFLSVLSQQEIEPQKALELREEARKISGFSYFKTVASCAAVTPNRDANTHEGGLFLDVEVVAMYW